MSIEIKNVTKRFGKFKALRGINLTVVKGELIALLGPSGCGKTTLLRIIAGLEIPDSGSIYMFDEDMTNKSVRDRNVGFVFQHYGLFRHMNVYRNISFGLKVKPWRLRPSRKEIKEKVTEKLKLVQLDWAAKRYPSQLSGGERQRVALARALAIEPKVLLLDEPFGALDAKVRRELRKWLRHLHSELHITSVFVTHDQQEALEVAHRVVVMNKGKIEQIGTPKEVYEEPASEFVYDFLGNVNTLNTSNVASSIGINIKDLSKSVFVRPHDIKITNKQKNEYSIPAIVENIFIFGATVNVELRHEESGKMIDSEITRDEYDILDIKEGSQVYIHIKNPKVF